MVVDLFVQRVAFRLNLSQAQANALHHAIDEYFHARPFDELAQAMHEKVADALVAAGYEPGYTHPCDGDPGTGSE